MRTLTGLALAGLLVLAPLRVGAQVVTSPQAEFGFALGADRKLADWAQLDAYYQKLAKESPRVRYYDLGPTTEGRPFDLLIISAPENLRQLDHYRAINAALADPRRTPPAEAARLEAEGKSILTITCNIHSTEIASSQTAAQFAYEMATGTTPEIEDILHNVILLLVPSLNPDGQQLVVDWYKKYLGTQYEGMGPVVLYNHYTGHDDNRDWYMFTQKETRLTVEKVLNPWKPQILYDVHQMGANGPRIYMPPWVDPIDPNVDPIIESSMNAVGMDTARDEIAAGQTGVLVDGVYDGFSPARQYIVYHGGLRLLTESASARIASPIEMPFDRLGKGIGYDAKVRTWNFPSPWPGGTWTLGDIVHEQLTAFFSIAHNMAANRETFLRNFYTVGTHAVTRADHPDWPWGYVVAAQQSDPLATATLINTLREGAVEVKRAGDGSYVIPLDQPYGSFAKTLLERQQYPDLRQYPGGPPQRPYDVTAQTLPLLLGVKVEAVKSAPADALQPVTATVHPAAGAFTPDPTAGGYTFGGEGNGPIWAAFALLRGGAQVSRSGSGQYFVAQAPGLVPKLSAVAATDAVSFTAASAPSDLVRMTLPRLGLYQSWVAQSDEGWTRWIFDQHAIPYTRVQDATLRAGNLRTKFDVILIPDQAARSLIHGNPASRTPAEYAGGIGEAGMASLKAFAQAGGTLIALNQASLAFLDWTDGQVKNVLDGVPNTVFYSPGSILSAMDAGGKPVAIFSEQSPAFAVSGAATSLITYTSADPLLSGWLLGGSMLNGRSALVSLGFGKGRLLLFGFKPQYRAQSQATYPFLFNALLQVAAPPPPPGPVADGRR